MTAITFTEVPSTVTLYKSNAQDDDVAMSAWVSFAGDDELRLQDQKKVRGLIRFLRRENHTTPFEHSTFTFRVRCPIGTAREIFRHRAAAYNEQSGRYTIFEPLFYVPAVDRPMIQEGKAGQYKFTQAPEWKAKLVQGSIKAANVAAWKAYIYMVEELGVAKEVARWPLPVNLMTTFYVTMSARNLMHFLELRSSEQALFEIRDVAQKMEEIFAEKMPLTYDAWVDRNNEFAFLQEVRKEISSPEEFEKFKEWKKAS